MVEGLWCIESLWRFRKRLWECGCETPGKSGSPVQTRICSFTFAGFTVSMTDHTKSSYCTDGFSCSLNRVLSVDIYVIIYYDMRLGWYFKVLPVSGRNISKPIFLSAMLLHPDLKKPCLGNIGSLEKHALQNPQNIPIHIIHNSFQINTMQ